MNAIRMIVELYGGPGDGQRLDVPVEDSARVLMVRVKREGVLEEVHAYEPAGRSRDGGRVWVYRWERCVGRMGMEDRDQ